MRQRTAAQMTVGRFSRADILSGKAIAESKVARPEEAQGYLDKDAELEAEKAKTPQHKRKAEKANKSKAQNKINSLVKQIDRLERQRGVLDKKIQDLQSTLASICDHHNTTMVDAEDDKIEMRCCVCWTLLYG